MTKFKTNSIWGIEPMISDIKSKRDLDFKCSRCGEIKNDDIFIYIWNEDGYNDNYKYCEDCSDTRFECNYGFKVGKI